MLLVDTNGDGNIDLAMINASLEGGPKQLRMFRARLCHGDYGSGLIFWDGDHTIISSNSIVFVTMPFDPTGQSVDFEDVGVDRCFEYFNDLMQRDKKFQTYKKRVAKAVKAKAVSRLKKSVAYDYMHENLRAKHDAREAEEAATKHAAETARRSKVADERAGQSRCASKTFQLPWSVT